MRPVLIDRHQGWGETCFYVMSTLPNARPRRNKLQKLVCTPGRQMCPCGDMTRSTVIPSWSAGVEELGSRIGWPRGRVLMWDLGCLRYLQVLKLHRHEHGEGEPMGILGSGEGVPWALSPTWQSGRSRRREVKQRERLQSSSLGLSREDLP